MHKLGTLLLGVTLATAGAWAHAEGQSAASGKSQRDGVTGQRSDGGIALQSDAATSNGGAAVVSGGVSLNARDQMRSQTPDHNVKMVFALNTGNYLSDVHVTVKNSAGKTVVDDTSNGPWLYAKLPPGTYTASATYGGQTKTQRFTVGRSGVKTAQFRWPASVEQQSVANNADTNTNGTSGSAAASSANRGGTAATSSNASGTGATSSSSTGTTSSNSGAPRSTNSSGASSSADVTSHDNASNRAPTTGPNGEILGTGPEEPQGSR